MTENVLLLRRTLHSQALSLPTYFNVFSSALQPELLALRIAISGLEGSQHVRGSVEYFVIQVPSLRLQFCTGSVRSKPSGRLSKQIRLRIHGSCAFIS